jgi:hypothetical protein
MTKIVKSQNHHHRQQECPQHDIASITQATITKDYYTLCYDVNLQNFIRLAFQLQTTSQDTLDLLSLSLSLNPLTGTRHRAILKSILHCMSQLPIPTRPMVFLLT